MINPRKNIVIVSAIFPPETVVAGRVCSDLAHFLTEKGHFVTVVCPQPSRPIGFDFSIYRNKLTIEEHSNLKIIRLPSFIHPEYGVWGRFRESLSFGFHSSWFFIKNIGKADLVYVNTWPIAAQLLISLSAIYKKVPLILNIQDIYPEALIEKLPAFLKKVIYKSFFWIDKFICRNAKQVVVISDNMYETYTKSRELAIDKVKIVANWQDETPFLGKIDISSIKIGLNIKDTDFVFMYLGNIGEVAGVPLLIEAFDKAGISDAKLVIAGDGAKKEECISLAKKLGNKNILFTTVPNGQVANTQALADVLLLPVKSGAAMSSIPSKMIAYMFSGKPILATVDIGSDTDKTIKESDCGWVGEAENLQWLINSFKEISQLPKENLISLGQNGKNYALSFFSKGKGVVNLSEIILQNCK